MQAVEWLETDNREGGKEDPVGMVVMLSRPPRLLLSLLKGLQGSAFSIARAGEPSPFATFKGRQRSS